MKFIFVIDTEFGEFALVETSRRNAELKFHEMYPSVEITDIRQYDTATYGLVNK